MKRAPSRARRTAWVVVVVAGLLLLGLVALTTIGCGEDIDAVYGQRKGAYWASVNGTGVLGEMFEEAGHTVYSSQILSPRLRRRADCIVWFPDDFQPPSKVCCQWLEDWLKQKPGRTLIYVGRDFDAALWYWEKIEPLAPAEQEREVRRRKSVADTAFVTRLKAVGKSEECDWFTLLGTRQHRKVRSLKGDSEWVAGIDPSKLEIELNHRLVPARDAHVVLESKGDMLVSDQQLNGSRLIVVANGSFLLNLPLVNHEHRKLAGQLIDEVGPPDQTVVFLESGLGGPLIFTDDPAAGPPTGMEIFNIWPTSWILLHLSFAGIIFCFSRLPIFGRPRDPKAGAVSDFGRHIHALGELLQRSGNTVDAMTRLGHYQQMTRPEAVGFRLAAPKMTGKRSDAGAVERPA